jgi:putative transposase
MKQITHKYRIYPNDEQIKLLAKTFGCVRVVWNNILDWRSKKYTMSAIKINYCASSKQLTKIKKLKKFAWLNEVSCIALQQILRSQDVAFKNFFTKRAMYPKFKSKHGKQSFRLTTNGFKIKNNCLYIAKSKTLFKMSLSRPLPDSINSLTISKDCADRYFVSFQGESYKKLLPILDNSIGLDVGLTHFLTNSNSEKIENPKLYRKGEKRLKILQKRLSRKAKGSNNRNKARLKVTRHHSNISDSRKDFLNKLSTKIIRENQTIIVEDLNISGLLKNHTLAKSISDASWSEFNRMLEYKAAWYGRIFTKVNRWFPSSQICSTCGHRGTKKLLTIRKWTCSKCGIIHDRDINAAININTAGLCITQ